MSLKKIVKLFSSIDIYGHQIEVNYKGHSSYRTFLGALFTLAVYSLICFNSFGLIKAFKDGTKQSENINLSQFDRWYSDEYNLKEHNM